MADPSDPETQDEPTQLRVLRRSVTMLTLTMVAGVLVVFPLLVIRLWTGAEKPAMPQLPAEITLPEGATARAVTFGGDWIAVVTTDDDILILDAATGDVRQSLHID
ncbi:DUF6476 family protein [Phaeobacter sp. HF9A]|uniref:DUF6476 family protein n=1 Tax=Phaeobacter sp. HF9A TaxID=2721561 RepID=UPI001430D37A|nr:DUF6476 family protein [Phaeobacter sp. HF9A]NIZ13095.1 hypothetical protein [Phaeobacter sp. HF9A]